MKEREEERKKKKNRVACFDVLFTVPEQIEDWLLLLLQRDVFKNHQGTPVAERLCFGLSRTNLNLLLWITTCVVIEKALTVSLSRSFLNCRKSNNLNILRHNWNI